MGLCLLLFVRQFKSTEQLRPAHLYISIILFVTITTISFTPHTITSIAQGPHGITDIVTGKLYLCISLLYVYILLAITRQIYKKYKILPQEHRKSFSFVLRGWIAFFIIALFTNNILPYFLQDASLSRFAPISATVMIVIIGYAIIRHNFLSIRSAIQRGTIYALLAIFVVGTYILTILMLSAVIGDRSVLISHISAGVATIVAVITVPRLERFLRKVTNPLFFKDYYDYDETLTAVYRAIRNEISIDRTLQQILTILDGTLYPEKIGVFTARDGYFYTKSHRLDAHQAITKTAQKLLAQANRPTSVTDAQKDLTSWMRKADYATSVPVIFDAENIGCLLLGEKKSGDPLTRTDWQLLTQTALALGPAVEKAHLFEQKQRQAETLRAEVTKRTEQIQGMQASQETMMINIAHTLKTPLTVLYGEISLLSKRLPADTWSSLNYAIENVSKSTSALLRLVRLENTTRPKDAKSPLVDCSALVEMLSTHYAQQAVLHDIDLSSKIAPSIYVSAEHDDLEETMMTLIENAIKYTTPVTDRPKKIVITLRRHEGSVIVSVKDTGIGIAKKDVSRAFERFYRGEAATRQRVPGSGIGLSICKMLIERNGGTIALESTLGQGTTICISLPIVDKA